MHASIHPPQPSSLYPPELFHLSIHSPIHPYFTIYPSQAFICLSILPSFHPSINLSSIQSYIHLPTHPSIHPFISLPFYPILAPGAFDQKAQLSVGQVQCSDNTRFTSKTFPMELPEARLSRSLATDPHGDSRLPFQAHMMIYAPCCCPASPASCFKVSEYARVMGQEGSSVMSYSGSRETAAQEAPLLFGPAQVQKL